MAKQFGEHIKKLRLNKNLLQRQVASFLEIDTPLFSKIERGERMAKKDILVKLAQILLVDKEELLKLWLADQILDVVQNEDFAEEVLRSVSQTLNSNNKNK